MKKTTTFTNSIDITFNYNAIADDYRFYRLDIPSGKGKTKEHYRMFYTDVQKKLHPDARQVVKMNGRPFYVLAVKKERQFSAGDFSAKKIGLSELMELPAKSLFAMMLSLMVGRSPFFGISENPYDLFFVHSRSRNSLTALRVVLSDSGGNLCLNLSATNFMRPFKSQVQFTSITQLIP